MLELLCRIVLWKEDGMRPRLPHHEFQNPFRAFEPRPRLSPLAEKVLRNEVARRQHSIPHPCKISAQTVRQIRATDKPLREIAEEFGLKYSYVWQVKNGYIRKGVV